MLVKLARVEITGKNLSPMRGPEKGHRYLWGNYIERSYSAQFARARTVDA
jgi:hypothetical protein